MTFLLQALVRMEETHRQYSECSKWDSEPRYLQEEPWYFDRVAVDLARQDIETPAHSGHAGPDREAHWEFRKSGLFQAGDQAPL